MRMLVERFEETAADFAFEADSAWWRNFVAASPNLPLELDEPLQIALRGYRMGADLLVDGRHLGSLLVAVLEPPPEE